MKNDDHLYLDVVQLSERGWTETMVKRFLGAPDRWKPVDHYANWTGKRTFFLERIQTTEASPEFEYAFSRSIRRRRIKEEKHAQFM
jgi:hypothetical protein